MRFSRQLVRFCAGWLGATLLFLGTASAAERSAGRLSAEARGLRVRSYRWDAVLLQRWAVLEDTAHPERPLWSELVETSKPLDAQAPSHAAGAAPGIANALPVVHSGDQVTLWSEESNVRLQLGAVSQQSGAIGDRIQLRVTGAGVNGSAGWQATGIVRGPGSVEMER